jgi:F0F1-type ATP synthase alpha subunit
LNETHQLLACGDDVDVLGDYICTIKKNIEAVIDASKEVGLEVNTEKTMCVLMYHHQNAGQNHNIKTANRSFENVVKFKYLGTIVTNQQRLIHEKIKGRLNSGNACYCSVQNLLFSHLLSKNIKIKIYKNYNFTCSFVWM